jgi:hypothetical protein
MFPWTFGFLPFIALFTGTVMLAGSISAIRITGKVPHTLCMSCISLPPPSEVMAPVLYHGHHSLPMLKRPSRIEQLQVDWKKLGTWVSWRHQDGFLVPTTTTTGAGDSAWWAKMAEESRSFGFFFIIYPVLTFISFSALYLILFPFPSYCRSSHALPSDSR